MSYVKLFNQFRAMSIALACTWIVSACFEIKYTEPETTDNTEESIENDNAIIQLSSLNPSQTRHNPEGLTTDEQYSNGMIVHVSPFYTNKTEKGTAYLKDRHHALKPDKKKRAIENNKAKSSYHKRHNKKESLLHIIEQHTHETQAYETNNLESLIENTQASDDFKEVVEHKEATIYDPLTNWHQFIIDRLKDWLPDLDNDTLDTDNIIADEQVSETSEARATETQATEPPLDDETLVIEETTTSKDIITAPAEDEPHIDSIDTDPLFPVHHFCTNSILLLAQSMTLSQLQKTCDLLDQTSELFHEVMRTSYQVVEDDYNDLIKIHIFRSFASYTRDIKKVSGLDFTASGGFFYEGDPSQPGNDANIYVFEKTYSNAIWNLEHEYIHHLNARYIKYGPVKNTAYYLFWEEGVAEYFAHNEVQKISGFSIKDVLNVNANSSQTQIYIWSYWLIRFLIEEKTTLFFELAELLKNNDNARYIETLDFIDNTYNDEFTRWLSKQ